MEYDKNGLFKKRTAVIFNKNKKMTPMKLFDAIDDLYRSAKILSRPAGIRFKIFPWQ